MIAITEEALAGGPDNLRRSHNALFHSFAIAHHRGEQRLAIQKQLIVAPDNVAREVSLIHEAKDLLTSWIGSLLGTELKSADRMPLAFHLNQLINKPK